MLNSSIWAHVLCYEYTINIGLPNPTALLCNHPLKTIMPIPSRLLLVQRKIKKLWNVSKKGNKKDKNHDTPRNYDFSSTGSIIVVQWEDGGLWNHGTVVEKRHHNHDSISYTICKTRTGWLVNRNSKHVKTTQITVKQYIWSQLDRHRITDHVEDM